MKEKLQMKLLLNALQIYIMVNDYRKPKIRERYMSGSPGDVSEEPVT